MLANRQTVLSLQPGCAVLPCHTAQQQCTKPPYGLALDLPYMAPTHLPYASSSQNRRDTANTVHSSSTHRVVVKGASTDSGPGSVSWFLRARRRHGQGQARSVEASPSKAGA